MISRPPSVRWVGFVVGATIVLTAFHFTDNFINVNDYPRQDWLSAEAIRIAAVISWPLYALAGILGYRAYRDGAFPRANVLLIVFSFVGLVSIGHFTAGSPDELTTHGLISVIIDGIMGFIVLGTAIWSILARRREPVPTGA